MSIVKYLIENSTKIVESGGLLTGFILVFIESFIPMLPLSFFVALNVGAFDFIIGCLISWIATCLGSFLCYKFFYIIDFNRFNKFKFINIIKTKIDRFSKIKFPELVLILTLPFTPSFLVNILSGFTKMSNRKFIASLLIGKFFSILFWGYIGNSVIKSIADIDSIIYIGITLLISYILSKIINKKFNIE